MKNIETDIVPFIQEHFPSFYEEEGPVFVAFVKAYYSWLQQSNNALNISRSLYDIRDVDKAPEQFLQHFKQKYLNSFPDSISVNSRLLLKDAINLYSVKGTSDGVRYLIRALFDEEATVYKPGDDVLKLSDGIWVKPVYLELSPSERTATYVAQQVIGTISGAIAFVERLVRRRIGTKYIDIAYLSQVQGDFQVNELIVPLNNLVHADAPTVIGSLTSLEIISGGAEFQVGDVFSVTSSSGKQGKARVTSISNETGRVFFTILDGGWGYSLDSSVLVSESVFSLSVLDANGVPTTNVDAIVGQRTNSNTEITDFFRFETIKQNLAKITYTSASPDNANLAVGDVLENYDGSGVSVANAVVVAHTTSNTTAGFVVVAPYQSINATFNANTSVNGTTNTITISSHSFINNMPVLYEVARGNTNVTGLSNGTVYYVTNTTTNTLQLASTLAGTVVNIDPTSISETGHKLTVTGNLSDIDVSFSKKGNTITFVASAYSNVSATANIIASTTSNTLGVINISSNGFYSSNLVPVIGVRSNTYAYVSNQSSGSQATFQVGGITDTQLVRLNPDFISSENTEDIVFYEINLNGNNSGAGLQFGSPITSVANSSAGNTIYGGFGFVKFPTSTIDSILFDCLRFQDTLIGSITSIKNINPGIDYNADPVVTVLKPEVFAYKFRDLKADISNVSSPFANGEYLFQSYTDPAVLISVSNFSGTAANGAVLTVPLVEEFIYQSNGTANIASGIVKEAGISGGSGTIKIINVTGTFDNTLSGATIQTLTSNATANLLTQQATTDETIARGIVKSANDTVMFIKRITLRNTFRTGETILGLGSGSTANLVSIDEDKTTEFIGVNALIDANVQVANNVATNLEVTDSGFGYIDGETVTLTSANSLFSITAQVNIQKQGISEGFYYDTKGFSSSNKKIHDNDFYQQFSYEVQTKVPFEKYIDILKKVTHLAGAKPFGKVVTTTYNASLIGGSLDIIRSYVGSYTGLAPTEVYTGSYGNVYTLQDIITYTGNAYTKTFTNYVAVSEQFTQVYTLTFSNAFTGQFSKAYTSSYSTNYTGSFTTGFTGFYTGYANFTTTFIGGDLQGYTRGGFFAGYGTAYNISYSSVYTNLFTTSFTGVIAWAGSYSGQYTNVFNTEYTAAPRTVIITPFFTSSFAASYSRAYGGYTSVYTKPVFTGAPAYTVEDETFQSIYSGLFTSSETYYTGPITYGDSFTAPVYTGLYTTSSTYASYVLSYTNVFTNVNATQTFADVFTTTYQKSYSTPYSSQFTSGFAQNFTTIFTTQFTGSVVYTTAYASYTELYTSAIYTTASYTGTIYSAPFTRNAYNTTYGGVYTQTSYTFEYTNAFTSIDGAAYTNEAVAFFVYPFTQSFTAAYTDAIGTAFNTAYTSTFTH